MAAISVIWVGYAVYASGELQRTNLCRLDHLGVHLHPGITYAAVEIGSQTGGSRTTVRDD